MPVKTFEYRAEAERVAMRLAIAFVALMHDLGLFAKEQQDLAAAERWYDRSDEDDRES